MVRFKNRHILVEFLSPSSLRPSLSLSLGSPGVKDAEDVDEEDDDQEEEDDGLPLLPTIPFLVPLPDPEERLKLGDESGSAIYRAVKGSVLDVFGDEGWGRVSSSFKVIYHSPLTTLTLLRVARPHYRTLWASLTLLRSIESQPILPRVVGVSGTIKKLQNKAIAYHRLVVAHMVSAYVHGHGQAQGHAQGQGQGQMGKKRVGMEEERRKLEREGRDEEEAMNAIQD